MDKLYTSKGNLKSIYISSGEIKASTQEFDTMGSLLQAFKAEPDSDNHVSFPVADVTKVVPYPETNSIDINFLEKEEEFNVYLEFTLYSEYESVLNYILQNNNKLRTTRIVEGSPKYIIQQSMYALAIVCFTFAMAYSAWEANSGGETAVSGARRGIKKLFILMGTSLGITGTILAGLAILVGFSYFSWRKYNKDIKINREGFTI